MVLFSIRLHPCLAIEFFNTMPGNPQQIKLNLILLLDSGSLAGMTYRLFNLLQHLAHHVMD